MSYKPPPVTAPIRSWMAETWQHHPGSPVHHVSHPDRDAWCGQAWGEQSFLGYSTGQRRCIKCRKLGEGS